MKKLVRRAVWICLLSGIAACVGLYSYAGPYGFAVVKRGGWIWSTVRPDDPVLPLPMRLALSKDIPVARPGPFQWREPEKGFEVAELPVLLADETEVDRILLSRVDPSLFRFVVRT